MTEQNRSAGVSTPVVLVVFAIVWVAVGRSAGWRWAWEMAFTLPSVLWAKRLLRAARRGEITRRIGWAATHGHSFQITNPDVYRRSESGLQFWSYFMREVVFFAAVSVVMLMPLVGRLVDRG